MGATPDPEQLLLQFGIDLNPVKSAGDQIKSMLQQLNDISVQLAEATASSITSQKAQLTSAGEAAEAAITAAKAAIQESNAQQEAAKASVLEAKKETEAYNTTAAAAKAKATQTLASVVGTIAETAELSKQKAVHELLTTQKKEELAQTQAETAELRQQLIIKREQERQTRLKLVEERRSRSQEGGLFGGLAGSVGKGLFGGGFAGNIATGAFTGVLSAEILFQGVERLVEKIKEFAIESDKLTKVQAVFEGIARTAGVEAPAMLEKMRESTEGVIDKVTLMRTAIAGLGSNLKLTDDQIVQSIGDIKVLAEAHGKDAANAIQRYTRMLEMGRVQTRGLAMAVGIHVTTLKGLPPTLNEAEKAQRQLNDALKQFHEQRLSLGELPLTVEEVQKRLKVALRDAELGFGRGLNLAPGTQVFLRALGLDPETTRSIEAKAEALGKRVGDILLGIVGISRSLKPAFDAVVEAVTAIGSAFSRIFGGKSPVDNLASSAKQTREEFEKTHPVLTKLISAFTIVAGLTKTIADNVKEFADWLSSHETILKVLAAAGVITLAGPWAAIGLGLVGAGVKAGAFAPEESAEHKRARLFVSAFPDKEKYVAGVHSDREQRVAHGEMPGISDEEATKKWERYQAVAKGPTSSKDIVGQLQEQIEKELQRQEEQSKRAGEKPPEDDENIRREMTVAKLRLKIQQDAAKERLAQQKIDIDSQKQQLQDSYEDGNITLEKYLEQRLTLEKTANDNRIAQLKQNYDSEKALRDFEVSHGTKEAPIAALEQTDAKNRLNTALLEEERRYQQTRHQIIRQAAADDRAARQKEISADLQSRKEALTAEQQLLEKRFARGEVAPDDYFTKQKENIWATALVEIDAANRVYDVSKKNAADRQQLENQLQHATQQAEEKTTLAVESEVDKRLQYIEKKYAPAQKALQLQVEYTSPDQLPSVLNALTSNLVEQRANLSQLLQQVPEYSEQWFQVVERIEQATQAQLKYSLEFGVDKRFGSQQKLLEKQVGYQTTGTLEQQEQVPALIESLSKNLTGQQQTLGALLEQVPAYSDQWYQVLERMEQVYQTQVRYNAELLKSRDIMQPVATFFEGIGRSLQEVFHSEYAQNFAKSLEGAAKQLQTSLEAARKGQPYGLGALFGITPKTTLVAKTPEQLKAEALASAFATTTSQSEQLTSSFGSLRGAIDSVVTNLRALADTSVKTGPGTTTVASKTQIHENELSELYTALHALDTVASKISDITQQPTKTAPLPTSQLPAEPEKKAVAAKPSVVQVHVQTEKPKPTPPAVIPATVPAIAKIKQPAPIEVNAPESIPLETPELPPSIQLKAPRIPTEIHGPYIPETIEGPSIPETVEVHAPKIPTVKVEKPEQSELSVPELPKLETGSLPSKIPVTGAPESIPVKAPSVIPVKASEPIVIEQPGTIEVKSPESIKVDTPGSIQIDKPADIKITAPDSIKVDTPKSIEVNAPESIKVEQPDTIQVDAPDAVKVEEPGNIQVDAPESIKVDAPGTVSIEAPEALTIKTPESIPVKTPESISVNAPESIPVRAPDSIALKTPGSIPVTAPASIPVEAAPIPAGAPERIPFESPKSPVPLPAVVPSAVVVQAAPSATVTNTVREVFPDISSAIRTLTEAINRLAIQAANIKSTGVAPQVVPISVAPVPLSVPRTATVTEKIPGTSSPVQVSINVPSAVPVPPPQPILESTTQQPLTPETATATQTSVVMQKPIDLSTVEALLASISSKLAILSPEASAIASPKTSVERATQSVATPPVVISHEGTATTVTTPVLPVVVPSVSPSTQVQPAVSTKATPQPVEVVPVSLDTSALSFQVQAVVASLQVLVDNVRKTSDAIGNASGHLVPGTVVSSQPEPQNEPERALASGFRTPEPFIGPVQPKIPGKPVPGVTSYSADKTAESLDTVATSSTALNTALQTLLNEIVNTANTIRNSVSRLTENEPPTIGGATAPDVSGDLSRIGIPGLPPPLTAADRASAVTATQPRSRNIFQLGKDVFKQPTDDSGKPTETSADAVGKFTGALLEAVGAVSSFIGSLTSAKSGGAGAVSGALGGFSLGASVGGPIGGAIGAGVGAVAGFVTGSKNRAVINDLHTLEAQYRDLMREFSLNSNNLQNTIQQLGVLIQEAQQMKASSKKGGGQYQQIIDQYTQQLMQLQDQQTQILRNLHEQLAVLDQPSGVQDTLSSFESIIKQFDQYIGAANSAAQAGSALIDVNGQLTQVSLDVANAYDFLSRSLSNYISQTENQLLQDNTQAVQDALQLNDLLYQRQQFLLNMNNQIRSVLEQGVLTRSLTFAQTKAQQVYQIQYDAQRQLDQMNEQISAAQFRVDSENQIFSLAQTRIGLEQQLLQLQNQQTTYDMQRIAALAALVTKLQGGDYSAFQSIIGSLPAVTSNAGGIDIASLIGAILGGQYGGTVPNSWQPGQPTTSYPGAGSAGNNYGGDNSGSGGGDNYTGGGGKAGINNPNARQSSPVYPNIRQTGGAGSPGSPAGGPTENLDALDRLIAGAYQQRSRAGYAAFRGQNL